MVGLISNGIREIPYYWQAVTDKKSVAIYKVRVIEGPQTVLPAIKPLAGNCSHYCITFATDYL
jgi:hypothetical protein